MPVKQCISSWFVANYVAGSLWYEKETLQVFKKMYQKGVFIPKWHVLCIHVLAFLISDVH